jgi:hypothetical protein
MRDIIPYNMGESNNAICRLAGIMPKNSQDMT